MLPIRLYTTTIQSAAGAIGLRNRIGAAERGGTISAKSASAGSRFPRNDVRYRIESLAAQNLTGLYAGQLQRIWNP